MATVCLHVCKHMQCKDFDTFREENYCTDELANLTLIHREIYKWFNVYLHAFI